MSMIFISSERAYVTSS